MNGRMRLRQMMAIGLMPSTTGSPGGKTPGEHMNDYIEEGGLFYTAAVELSTPRFALPWLDRATHAVTEQPPALFDTTGKPVCPEPKDPDGQLASPLGGVVLTAPAQMKPSQGYASSPPETQINPSKIPLREMQESGVGQTRIECSVRRLPSPL